MKEIACPVLAALFVTLPCHAGEPGALEQSDAIWDAIKVFEGDHRTVTGDFDCQGMSVGVAQWNIGKSQESVKKIILSIPTDQLAEVMPQFGQRLIKALVGTRSEALSFVRSLQTFKNPDCCVSKIRRAQWTSEGRKFVGELSLALATDSSLRAQRSLRGEIFSRGLRDATDWGKAVRGADAVATPKEIAYFVDMQLFNGGGLSKFGVSTKPLDTESRSICAAKAIKYLKTADDNFLLHKKAARMNAGLLNAQSLSRSETDLFCKAHQVALKLNAPYAKQFRLTVINRRAAILFGNAYYSDHDSIPVSINFSKLSGPAGLKSEVQDLAFR